MVNYVKVTNRKTFQNKIFPELNSKKHTPSPTIWFLRNCGIAQNLSFAKAELGNFARNDFCEWLRKLLFFRAKLMRKERKILLFVPQKLCKSFTNRYPKYNGESNLIIIYLSKGRGGTGSGRFFNKSQELAHFLFSL